MKNVLYEDALEVMRSEWAAYCDAVKRRLHPRHRERIEKRFTAAHNKVTKYRRKNSKRTG